MNEPFYYLRAEDRVPRNVVRVIIGGAITAVAPGAFRGFPNLRTVEILEDVEVIGAEAFAYCPNLTRLDASRASSLRTMGDHAFYRCERLLELMLCEGIRRIGRSAFCPCDDLRRITVPSSVVEIGEFAFSRCRRLSEVTLAGGMVMAKSDAFFIYTSCLERIAISSMAIVVEDGENGSGRAAIETRGAIVRNPDRLFGWGPTRLILTSPYLASMSSEDIKRAKDAINRIAGGRPPEEGPLDLAAGDAVATEDDWVRVREGADRIRARFLDLLSAHRREMASNVLERALERGVARTISSFLPDIEE